MEGDRQEPLQDDKRQEQATRYEPPQVMPFDPVSKAAGSCPASAPMPCTPGASDTTFCSTGTIVAQ